MDSIIFTIQSNNTIRVKQKDVFKFKELIKPEVEKIKCMMYKTNVVFKFR